MNPKAVLEFAAANNVKMVDLRFTDLPGLWHTFPIHFMNWKRPPLRRIRHGWLQHPRLGRHS